jgi:hypothetical protein
MIFHTLINPELFGGFYQQAPSSTGLYFKFSHAMACGGVILTANLKPS